MSETSTWQGLTELLSRSTVPLGGRPSDLTPFGGMVGEAVVVGVGEATHSSREFVTTKQRLFEYLTAEMGFTTFALEVSWSTGLRLNDYVLHGIGDPGQVMRDELQVYHRLFNTAEILDHIEAMRAYNAGHSRKVTFMGCDLAFAGEILFDRVTEYVRRHVPALLPTVTDLYRGLRPTATTLAQYMATYLAKPLAERQELDRRARTVTEILRQQGPGLDSQAHAWAVQHATAISQTAHEYGYDMTDPVQLTAAIAYRDQAMAANIAWWHARTGQKIMLSAHNEHVGYVSAELIPKTQGAFLRDQFGDRYVSVGTSFDRGSFNAGAPDGQDRAFTLGPAPKGNNEYILAQAHHPDYLLDLRTAPDPLWSLLASARPTRNIGQKFPAKDQMISLADSYDIVLHLDAVSETHLLP